MKKIINFFKDESGVAMVEYALLLALIAVFCLITVQLVGTNTQKVFQGAADSLKVTGS